MLKFTISLENTSDSLRLAPWSAFGQSSCCLKTTIWKVPTLLYFEFKSENNVSLIIEYSQRRKENCFLVREISEFYSYLIKSLLNSSNVNNPLPSAIRAANNCMLSWFQRIATCEKNASDILRNYSIYLRKSQDFWI